MEGRLGRDALDAATKKSNIRIVATQSFSFTQESVVNSVPLVRAAAKIYDADLLLLTSNSAGALPLLAQLLPEAGLNPKKSNTLDLQDGISRAKHKLAWPQGGWFAVPETARYEVFSDHYFAEYREKPHRWQDLHLMLFQQSELLHNWDTQMQLQLKLSRENQAFLVSMVFSASQPLALINVV